MPIVLGMDRKPIVLGIAGSRELTTHNTKFVSKSLADFFLENEVTRVISGGARGVDTIAERSAEVLNIDTMIIRPENPKIKYSYLERNKTIVDNSDKILVFWDGKSRGSKFVIDYCKAIAKPYRVYLLP